MKNINLILALALIMSFTACKKNREVIIQAQNLTDLSDGSHYAGANYVVLEKKTTLYGEQNKNVASGVLDDNGHASFDLKMKNNRRYALGIQEPSNVCYTQITIEEYLINGENNTFNFEYAPCGTVNLPFVNSNCEGENDEFRYKYYYTQDTNIYILGVLG